MIILPQLFRDLLGETLANLRGIAVERLNADAPREGKWDNGDLRSFGWRERGTAACDAQHGNQEPTDSRHWRTPLSYSAVASAVRMRACSGVNTTGVLAATWCTYAVMTRFFAERSPRVCAACALDSCEHSDRPRSVAGRGARFEVPMKVRVRVQRAG